MLYEEKLRRQEKIPDGYKIVEAKGIEVRTNNPYVDIEAYFFNVLNEKDEIVASYELEVVTKTSSNSETVHINKLS